MKKLSIVAILYTNILITSASAQTLAPDGTYVGGSSAELAPDGTYVGGISKLARDGTYVGGEPHLAPNGTHTQVENLSWHQMAVMLVGTLH